MILLFGDNDYELTREISRRKAKFSGVSERYDAAELTSDKLADIFAGQTLFAERRVVFIDMPSANPDLWQHLEQWSKRASDDTQVILVEPKPDKRTSSFKWLKANAELIECTQFDERNPRQAGEWASRYANEKNVAASESHIRRLVGRVGNDQWELAHALDKLALADEITDSLIDEVAAAKPSENVFALFEIILNGDTARLRDMLETLRLTEDPFKLLGLISSQAMQLAVLTLSEADVSKVANDINAKSTYPLQKLAPFSVRMNRADAREIIGLLAAADSRLKQSDADPWVVLESTMVQMASRFASE